MMKTESYEQKLETIYNEVGATKLSDYPKDLLKSLEKEARAAYRQGLKDSEARFSEYTEASIGKRKCVRAAKQEGNLKPA